eukprot:1257349-Rhodomonas_salina.1
MRTPLAPVPVVFNATFWDWQPGWAAGNDPSSGRTYYYNVSTNTTQWEFPTDSKAGGYSAPSNGGGRDYDRGGSN